MTDEENQELSRQNAEARTTMVNKLIPVYLRFLDRNPDLKDQYIGIWDRCYKDDR
jgi:hypothetical protein